MKQTPLKRKTPLRAKRFWNPKRTPLKSKTTLKSFSTLKTKTPLKTKSVLKAKKPMRKIGKVGRANLAANKIIKKEIGDIENKNCELGPVLNSLGIDSGCLSNFALTIAHRHKRNWYKGDAEKLSDKKQYVIGCVCCHDTIEHNAELTEKVFARLRGEE